MKNFREEYNVGKKLLTFAIASFMCLSVISIVGFTPVVSVPSVGPPVVDGVISPGEYDDALYIPLTGPWPPSAPFPPSLVAGYVYWDTQYLWIAVNESVPNWGTGGSFIEFMWDAGPSSPSWYHAWVLFSDGNWQYVRCGKPTGCWGWAGDPFPGTSWWATGTATEFKIDYTLYGTSFGDTIKLVVDTADNSVPPGPFGDCQVWPANPTYYPCESPLSVATWGTIVLGGNQPPVADAGGPYSGMSGDSILLDGSGSYDLDGTIVSYEWDLDDDGFYDDATGATTTKSWSFEGSYPISLKVTDDGGLSDIDDTTVNIGDHAVDGIISPDEYDGGMAVQLVEGLWTVDALIDWDARYLYVAVDEPCPTYIEFAFDAGAHRSFFDVFTLFSSGSKSHQISPKPPGSGWSGDPYTFDAFSDTATEFKIDYTDFGIALGDTIKMCIERGSTPNAYWPEGGIIWDNSYRGPDPSTWGDVTLTPPADIPPVADANGPYEDTDCDDDYTINLDGLGSTDPDGTIVNYTWDFGDGTGYHNDIGATPSNTYPTFGEYTVTLNVTDNDGLTDEDTTTVKIYGVNANIGGPYEDTDCDDDYTIDFDGSGSTGFQAPLTYDWDFGDGTGWHNDIGATPSNTYPSFGEYTVTLRVTESGNGCYAINTTSAKIFKVTANANGPYSSVDGTPVQFDSSGSTCCCGDTLSYSWDFDDGETSTIENPTHIYTSIGVYTVTLTVEGSISHCTDVDTATVTVTSTVTSDADGPYEGVVGIPIDFTGSASGGAPPYQYYWSFGDDTYSPEQNPSYTYDAPGTYKASLKVTDDIEATDTDHTDVVIHPAEAVVADADGPYSANVDEVIQFHGSAVGGTQPYSWYWEFGDGDTSTLQNPTHAYTTSGGYTATLTVTDTYGMTDDDTAQVSIGGYPPNKPTIHGSDSGKPGTEYEYTFNAVDPDGDNVKYHINWGDTNSETTTFSSSGTDVKVKHTWSTGGTYTIKATAEDSNGLVGPEGTLSVSMPRNRATQTLFLQFLENLMQRFPLLAKLLQQYPILHQLLQRVLRL